MTKYRGLFGDYFEDVEANSEEEAQQKMKQILIKDITEDTEPFTVWEIDEEDYNGD